MTGGGVMRGRGGGWWKNSRGGRRRGVGVVGGGKIKDLATGLCALCDGSFAWVISVIERSPPHTKGEVRLI